MVSSMVVVIIIALIFSAFFSGMEIAFITSNRLQLEIERKKSPLFDRIANIFLHNPGQYITTILVGNNVALVIFSLNMSLLINTIGARYGYIQGSVLVETLISTIIIIIAGEFIPKAIFRNNPTFFLRLFAVPVYLVYLLLYPIAKLSTLLSISLLRLFGLKIDPEREVHIFDRVDLAHLLEESNRDDDEQEEVENEIKLFRNALEFSNVMVRDCMVPRIDIEAVDIMDSIEHITEKFVETKFSRVFVYKDTIDNIIGYVNSKGLFKRPKSIREVLMSVDYVPESMLGQRLLSIFTKKNRTVAVVIDELGGTAGIVSMEDVLEEIFGEIEDEHDAQHLVEMLTPEGEYILSCRFEVDYLNDKYPGLNIPESDEYDTLAGYIIYNNEDIPRQGEELVMENKRVKILRTSGSKLDLVRITTIDDCDKQR